MQTTVKNIKSEIIDFFILKTQKYVQRKRFG